MFAGTHFPHLRRQNPLLTAPQQALYKVLTRALSPEALVILTRVNLGHLVKLPNDDAKYRAYWHHICRRWVDFVLCSPLGFTPVLAIKLETRSERRQRLQRGRTHPNERDKTEEILTGIKIPLLRLIAVDNYDFSQVINEIRRVLLGVLATEKQHYVTQQNNTEEIYIEHLDGEINKPLDARNASNAAIRSHRRVANKH